MSEVSLPHWNSFLANHPNAHILQSGEWGELKSAFGWEAVRVIAGDCGAQILFRKLPLRFTLGYMPKGPVISDQCSVTSDQLSVISEQFWEEVDTICRSKRAIFLKVEPDEWHGDHAPRITHHVSLVTRHSSLVVSPHSIQPHRTLIVDLRGSEEEILARMKQKCRYNIRLAGKKGVTVRAWDDIESFHRMMLATGERDVFGVHSLEYYRRAYELFHKASKIQILRRGGSHAPESQAWKPALLEICDSRKEGMCELLVAEYEGRPLAALMVFGRGKRAWYFYGASTDEARNLMPTYLLQWEAMRWAKARGCEEYDLWGIPDEDKGTLEANFETRHDGLWGVYRFKRGFGGELRRAAGALDRVYNLPLYHLYLWRMSRGAEEPGGGGAG